MWLRPPHAYSAPHRDSACAAAPPEASGGASPRSSSSGRMSDAVPTAWLRPDLRFAPAPTIAPASAPPSSSSAAHAHTRPRLFAHAQGRAAARAPDADDLLYAEELSQLAAAAAAASVGGQEAAPRASFSSDGANGSTRRWRGQATRAGEPDEAKAEAEAEAAAQSARLERVLARRGMRPLAAHAPAEAGERGRGAPSFSQGQDHEQAQQQGQQEDEEEEWEEEEDPMSRAYLVSYFLAGGAAGAASRTVVSPLERLKIIMQVQPHQKAAGSAGGSALSSGGKGAYAGVWSGLVKMWREEGVAGFMRGNGINCLRIAPYSAVQFSSYEVLKSLFLKHRFAAQDDQWEADHPEEAEKHHHPHHTADELAVWERLSAGALAGIASVVSTYPLDLVRSRISIASASIYSEAKQVQAQALAGSASSSSSSSAAASSASTSRNVLAGASGRASVSTLSLAQKSGGGGGGGGAARAVTSGAGASASAAAAAAKKLREELKARQKKVPGIWAMTVKVYTEEGGVRGLYRGCVPTSAGVAPYVSLNFIGYETLRTRFQDADGKISDIAKLGCGAAAGSVSQTLTYPLDVLRRRMQVAGMRDSQLGYSDTTSWGVIRTIVRQDGLRGLYRGLWPNLLKVAPSIGVSFWTYETVRGWLEPHHHHAHH